MKTLILLLLVQHVVISAKAGMVTLSHGWVNLDARSHVGEGNPLTTGTDSKVEILLSPDSYLRMKSDSEIVLECEDLDQIAVRLTKGEAIIDVARIDKKMPISVRVGDLETHIRKSGIYLFQSDGVFVLKGELRVGPAVGQEGMEDHGFQQRFQEDKDGKIGTTPVGRMECASDQGNEQTHFRRAPTSKTNRLSRNGARDPVPPLAATYSQRLSEARCGAKVRQAFREQENQTGYQVPNTLINQSGGTLDRSGRPGTINGLMLNLCLYGLTADSSHVTLWGGVLLQEILASRPLANRAHALLIAV